MSVLGVVALNVLFFVAGTALLWGMRGLASWSELWRLAGVAHLLGLAVVVVSATTLLVAGVPPSVPTVLALVVLACGCGLVLGRRRPRPALRLPPRREPFRALGLALAAATGAYLGVLALLAPQIGIWEPDGWTFWTTKAKAIYFFGGLDERTFTTLPGPTYPIFTPTLQAMNFHFIGAADTLALHLQYWFLFAGFLAAVAGFLRPRVPLVLIWPFLLLLAVTPAARARALSTLSDFTVDGFFALGSLALVLWCRSRERWLLLSAGVFLTAAVATKREGLLLVLALVAGTIVATRGRRTRAAILAVGASAFLLNLPWRLWWLSHDLTGESAGAGARVLVREVDRIWPATTLLLGQAFSWDAWLLVLPVALCAAALALWTPARPLAVAYLGTSALAFSAFVWIFWAVPDLPTSSTGESPAPRAVGALTLLAAAFAPLLLSAALEEDHALPARDSAVKPFAEVTEHRG